MKRKNNYGAPRIHDAWWRDTRNLDPIIYLVIASVLWLFGRFCL